VPAVKRVTSSFETYRESWIRHAKLNIVQRRFRTPLETAAKLPKETSVLDLPFRSLCCYFAARPSVPTVPCETLIRQSEGVHHAAARTDDILLPIYRVTDRTARIGAAQIRVPQGLARIRVEGYEVPIHATPEY
jgi:hypothetical protein